MYAWILAVAVGTTSLVATPAVASSCPSPGGQGWGFASAENHGDFVFTGKGWGHGVGMSQFGAQGAAELGCTATDILTTYYQGVAVEGRTMPSDIRVGLIPNTPTGPRDYEIAFENVSKVEVPWTYQGTEIKDEKGNNVRQLPGKTWTVHLKVDGGNSMFVIVQSGTGEVWRSPVATAGKDLKAHLGNSRILKVHDKGRRYNRGTLELRSSAGMYLTNHLGFEEYLYGLAEMPSSWWAEALKSQAIVGRSYAAVKRNSDKFRSNCVCHLFDSVYDQAFTGYEKEAEATYGARWVAAVNNTAGTVLTYDGKIVTGFYASSHGGHSESGAYVWGGGAPHLQAIDDSRWEAAASKPANPYRTWVIRKTPEELGKAFGVGVALRVELPDPKGTSGRIGNPSWGAGGMQVIGTTGTVTVSGDTARWRLGLRSTLFTVINPPIGGEPITGDWDGDGDTELGWYRDGDVALRMDDGSVTRFRFGRAGDQPITGDWNGDGVDTIGVVRGIRWYLRNSHSGGVADRWFDYGRIGDIALPGNWDGKQGDEAGIIRDGTWHLNDTLGGGTAKWSFVYGRVTRGDLPIVGDWLGEGQDRVGIVRDGEWHLRYQYASGIADHSFVYGRVTKGDIPVVGDWGGDDADETAGVVRGPYWYLKQSNSDGAADRTVIFLG